MKNKVAIITPLFNRGYIIQETAASIFAQSHQDWEWIIVDDGSTDDSWETIQAFTQKDTRVKAYQRNREPKGACTCRNIATEFTTSDWLIFLDSDDLLHPECLAQRIRHSTSQAGQNEVLYYPTLVFENSIEESHLWDDPKHPAGWIEAIFSMTPPCQSTGPFWPAETWRKLGGWREDLTVWQDLELHARSHFEGINFKAAANAEPDNFIRVSPDSLSRVGFHNREKLESRLTFIRFCWSMIILAKETESQRKALAAMTLSAVRNGANLKMFKEMKALLALPNLQLTPDEYQLGVKLLRYRRWKLDRFPPLRKQIQRQWDETLPSSGRKLGRQRWTSPTP